MIPTIERIPSPLNLTSELSNRLREQILSGALRPGDKLPTEQELIESAGVSRTVVREAIATLRAERLVISRQGVGVFVAKRLPEQPFLISTENLNSIDEVVLILELRLGVEIEAAGLAAERRTAGHLQRMRDALAAFNRDVEGGGIAADSDIGFHHVIAEAAANRHILNLIEYFGRLLFVPGRRILFDYRNMISHQTENDTAAYLAQIRLEHDAIYAAVKSGLGAEARDAMRRHLQRALEAYRQIAKELPAGARKKVSRNG